SARSCSPLFPYTTLFRSGPIIGSTITPVVVFLPLSLLTGVTGVFFRSLALTMAVALLPSLVLALFFTPVLAQRFVAATPASPARSEEHTSELQLPDHIVS